MDQDLREAVIIELLSPRDKTGKITEAIDLNMLEVDTDALVELINWAQEHVLDFFLKGLERSKALQDQNMTRVRALMPSSNGTGR
jgi:hypothetical protein